VSIPARSRFGARRSGWASSRLAQLGQLGEIGEIGEIGDETFASHLLPCKDSAPPVI
jgi:hypothetical protein